MSGTSVLHNTLWRQGSILPRELLDPELLPKGLDPQAKLVLISHSCDIVQPSYEAEPYVELLIAHPATAIDGLKTNGKNPRRLQFPISVGGPESVYEISIHDKIRINRRLLETGTPDASCRISPGNIRRLGTWAGKRYLRAAFPGAFDRRLKSAMKKLRSSLERHGEHVLGVFLYLNTDLELPETEEYRIIVRVVAEKSAVEDDNEEQRLKTLVAEMNVALGNCTGIDVLDLSFVSETEFTYEDLRNSSKWDFDYLSDAEAEDVVVG